MGPVPHIIIEYSDNLGTDIEALVDVVHTAALLDGLADVAGLRTRAAVRTNFRVATGDPDLAFVAITARMGPGRGREAKIRFLTALLDAAEGQVGVEQPVAWSAEVQEIDPGFRINRNRIRDHLRLDRTQEQP
jgi:5-carboxymethyl-2-hydroxymuconate isomerase